MLRIHFMQQWFTLSDPAMEEVLHDVPLFREFVGLSLGQRLPDESTILRFRHLLERRKPTDQILAVVNQVLTGKGLILKAGTVVDTTLIAAPSSTKNQSGTRDPEMRQTKNGKLWYFGMKAHIGVGAQSGLVHTVRGSAANVNEVVAMRPGKRRALDNTQEVGRLTNELERMKARIRAKVEHPFRVITRQFGHVKVRYRGMAKDTAQFKTLFALANLWVARRRLLILDGRVRANSEVGG